MKSYNNVKDFMYLGIKLDNKYIFELRANECCIDMWYMRAMYCPNVVGISTHIELSQFIKV